MTPVLVLVLVLVVVLVVVLVLVVVCCCLLFVACLVCLFGLFVLRFFGVGHLFVCSVSSLKLGFLSRYAPT